MRALLAGAIQALKAEKKARGVDDYSGVDWYKELKPSLTKIGALALTPSTEPGKSAGLTFHYPPYAVGPYAEGPYAVFPSPTRDSTGFQEMVSHFTECSLWSRSWSTSKFALATLERGI